MASWKELKEKAINLTGVGVNKAKELGEVAKLNLDNLSEEENIRKAYAEIGKRYVSMNADAPDAAYADMFGKIRTAQIKISANKEKITKIKEEGNLTDEDFEAVSPQVLKAEKFTVEDCTTEDFTE